MRCVQILLTTFEKSWFLKVYLPLDPTSIISCYKYFLDARIILPHEQNIFFNDDKSAKQLAPLAVTYSL